MRLPSFAVPAAFLSLVFAGLFFHAMLVPCMPWYAGGVYEGLDDVRPEVRTDVAIDGMFFLIIYGWAFSACFCGALWSAFLAWTQRDLETVRCLDHFHPIRAWRE